MVTQVREGLVYPGSDVPYIKGMSPARTSKTLDFIHFLGF